MEKFRLKEKERYKDGLVTTYFTLNGKTSVERISIIKKLILYWIKKEDAQILVNNIIKELELEDYRKRDIKELKLENHKRKYYK